MRASGRLQIEWYRKVLMRDLRALGDGRGAGSTTVQNIVMHLRKVCNHPYLFEGAEPGPPFVEGEHIVGNSGKLAVLDKLLKRLKEGGHRVLVFVTMTRMLDILQDYCGTPAAPSDRWPVSTYILLALVQLIARPPDLALCARPATMASQISEATNTAGSTVRRARLSARR